MSKYNPEYLTPVFLRDVIEGLREEFETEAKKNPRNAAAIRKGEDVVIGYYLESKDIHPDADE